MEGKRADKEQKSKKASGMNDVSRTMPPCQGARRCAT